MAVLARKLPAALSWRAVRTASRRLTWGVADQAMSTLTNFLLSIIVARTLGAAQFGAFSLAYVTYGFAINASRGLSIEPLLVRFSGTDVPTWRRAAAGCSGTALLVGIVTGACALTAGLLIGGTTKLAFIALALTLPGLLLQDSWRYSFFALGRGRHAFINDTIWAALQIPALVFLKMSGHANVFWFVLAWGSAASVGAAIGSIQAGVLPSLARVPAWLRRHRDLGPRYLAENTGGNASDMLRSYIVSGILGLAAVGYVQAAGVLMGPFKIIYFGMSLIILPEAARLLRRSPRQLPVFCLAVSVGLTVLGLAWGAVLLVALPRGLGHLMLGSLWRPTYPLVVPATLSIMSMCASTGSILGLHALGAARRSLRAVLIASVVVTGCAFVGAATGGTLGTMRYAAAAAWFGTLVSWWQLRQALTESGRVELPAWLLPGHLTGRHRMPASSIRGITAERSPVMSEASTAGNQVAAVRGDDLKVEVIELSNAGEAAVRPTRTGLSSPPMGLPATSLRRPSARELDQAEARDRSVRRRLNAAWGLLYFNTLTFVPGTAILHIPSFVGKGLAQAALPLSILVVLTVNPKLRVRPNVFLCVVCLLVVDTVITAIDVHHLGAIFRTFRLAEFVVALWLFTPWWGRRDMLLLRIHLRWLFVALGSVLLGLLIAPGRAFSFNGRLTGVIWPMLPTQIAQYAAVAVGLTIVLWLARGLSGRVALVAVAACVPILLLAHTRTALVGLVAGLLVAGLSLFVTSSRVRRFFAAGAALASLAVITLAGVLTNWLARGENAQGLATLSGRTNFWALVLNTPRTTFQEVFGFGLSTASVNGLPIDSNWLASYMQEGLFGVVVCATMLLYLLVAAFFQPAGVRRALTLFIVTYCTLASITETGFTDASTYLLDLAVAASLLVTARVAREVT